MPVNSQELLLKFAIFSFFFLHLVSWCWKMHCPLEPVIEDLGIYGPWTPFEPYVMCAMVFWARRVCSLVLLDSFQLFVLYFSSSIMMSSSPAGSREKRYMNPVSKPANVIKSHSITWSRCLFLYVFLPSLFSLAGFPHLLFLFNMGFQGYCKTCRATSSFWRIYRHPIFGKEFGKTIQWIGS